MGSLAALLKKPKGSIWQDYTGPDAATLEITYETSKQKELWLEELTGDTQFGKLRLKGDNAKAGVAPGSYLLFFRGKTQMPNEEFDIEITGPKEAKWKPKPAERSDLSGNIAGIQPIKIDK